MTMSRRFSQMPATVPVMRPALAVLVPALGALATLAALAVLAALVAGCGDDPEPTAEELTRDGWARFETRDYAGAQDHFTRAVSRDDGHAEAYNGLGWSRLRMGSCPAALEAFDAALSLGMAAADPLVGRAIIRCDVHPVDVEAAVEDALAALTVSPTYAFAHDPTVDWRDVRLLLARAYFALGEYGAADEQVGLLGGHRQGSTITDGLTAYWSFDEDFTATSGGAAYDCVEHWNVSLAGGGRFGAAAFFSGGCHLYVDTPVIVQGQDHTFSVWYRLDFPYSQGSRHIALETAVPGDPNLYAERYWLRKDPGADVGEFLIQTYDDRAASVTFPEACGTSWHNIVVTYDADDAGCEHSIYLDGRGVATLGSSALLKDAVGLRIGAHVYNSGSISAWLWYGLIDDVAFWNRVLTAPEIAAIQEAAVGELEVPVSSPTYIRDLLAEIERLEGLYGR